MQKPTNNKKSPPQHRTRPGEQGRLAGEDHPRARYTDHEIEQMRTMHEELGYGSRRLCRIFECSRRHMRDILAYKRRR